jgi:hypothetical protein
MHRKILKDLTDEQLRDFADETIMMIKETNKELYDKLEIHLYKMAYGCHFNEWMLEKATSSMVNEDGTVGAHWSLEQTNSVAKSSGIIFDKFNQYDWNYAMNMIYSDYYGAVTNDTSSYVKLAKRFLDDKDAQKGKALNYYLAMRG